MPEKTTDSLAVIKSQATKMQNMLDEFQVTDDQSLALVADKIKNVKTLAKAVDEQKKKFTDPANAILKEAREKFDPIIKQCKNAEIVLKQRAGAYMQKKDDERRAEEARIAARVEKGTMKEETAMRKMEAMPEVQTTVRTDQGAGLRMSKRRVAVIESPDQVPDEYWVIDEVRVRRDALERDKNGEPQIPGVMIREEASISSV
ncbi:MAG: hypothetical protein WC530_09580 [Candidatus Omnitrophota bacterium]